MTDRALEVSFAHPFARLALVALTGCASSVAPAGTTAPRVDAATPLTLDASVACTATPSALAGLPCAVDGAWCGGACTDPCDRCLAVQCRGGTWRSADVPPAACDAGGTVDASPPPADDAAPPDPTGALLTWQAPAEDAGPGPALVVRGDGTMRVWSAVAGFDVTAAPPGVPDRTFTFAPAVVGDLFRRWGYVHRGPALPRAPDTGPCRGTLYVRSCAACDGVTVQYRDEFALEPTIDLLLIWFETNLPADVLAAQPGTYCRTE